jgi:hypothetical protein
MNSLHLNSCQGAFLNGSTTVVVVVNESLTPRYCSEAEGGVCQSARPFFRRCVGVSVCRCVDLYGFAT